MRRLLRRHRRDDAGLTLIEILVSMTIMSVLVTMVYGVIIATQKQTAGAGARLDDIDQARMALDVVSRTLRTAVEPAQLQVYCTACSGAAASSTAITDARPLTISLYSNTDAGIGPNLVSFTVAYDATLKMNTLVKTTQPPDSGSAPNFVYTACTPGPGCSKSMQILIRGVVMPTATDPPFFQFYNNQGAALVPPTNASLVPADLIQIDAIGINMRVNKPNNFKTGPTTIYSRVGLPNSGTGVLVTPSPTP